MFRRNPCLIFLLATYIILHSCNADVKSIPSEETKSETQEMVDELKEIFDNIDPSKITYFKNTLRAEYAVSEASIPGISIEEKWNKLTAAAYEYLNAGKNTLAINYIERTLQDDQLNIPQQTEIYLKKLLALAYLRIGEQNNCIENPNAASCILPIESEGIYTMKAGSESAISIYQDLLKNNPKDFESKWLMNFAYMTIGQYPDEVPKEHLIPPTIFKQSDKTNPFINQKLTNKMSEAALSGGAIVDDFNGDGLLDIVATSWGHDDNIKVFKNLGNGKFEDVTSGSGLEGLTSGLNIKHADYDNDGDNDILVLRGAWFREDGRIPNSLIRNLGNFKFEDVTKSSGMYSRYPTQAAVWTDLNLDGWLDLVIANESTMKYNAPVEVFLNDSGFFTNVTDALKMNNFRANFKGIASGDIDNDGDQDLYFSVLGGDNILLQNNLTLESFSFSNITGSTGASTPFASFPTWFWDYNNDGHLDIFCGSYDMQYPNIAANLASYYEGNSYEGSLSQIHINNGDGTFKSVDKDFKEPLYVMGSNYGDINNDGYPDMYLATGAPTLSGLTPNKLFVNDKGRSFIDATTTARLGHVQKGHAVSFGDIDKDGDIDIFHVLGGAYEGDVFHDALFINTNENRGNFINILCEGTISNRSAIGARIKVVVKNKKGSTSTFYHLVDTGSSFGSNSLEAEIGLGDAIEIDSLIITWPNKEQSSFITTDVPLNSFISVKEGDHQLSQR